MTPDRRPGASSAVQESPLAFLRPKGWPPVMLAGEYNSLLTQLTEDPETHPVMEQIINGPNVRLYERLLGTIFKRIDLEEKSAARTERLIALEWMATMPFFGNAVTDAIVEGLIFYGDATKWNQANDIDLMHLSEIRRPYNILLRRRVEEIRQGESSLPTNENELRRNIDLQIQRIEQQMDEGILIAKARALGVQPSRGEQAGRMVISYLQEIRDEVLPVLLSDEELTQFVEEDTVRLQR